MNLLKKLAARFGYGPIRRDRRPNFNTGTRGFSFGESTRLTNDWIVSHADADKELRAHVKLMRDRSRELERNNDYVRRFLKLLENNVLGAEGIGMQMKITEPVKTAQGVWIKDYDTRANQIIEDAWRKWGRKEFCTVTRDLTWLGLQRLSLRSAARDGAFLAVKHSVRTPFAFAIEPLEIDYLDIDFNQAIGQGREIRMGIEYDASGMATTYHLFRRHPGNTLASSTLPARRPVAASQMLHLYHPERVGQSTGAPWIHSAGTALKHLGAYTEAEVIASRAAASKMAFLERAAGPVEYQGSNDASGNRQMEISPGSIEELPPGMTLKPFDPTHPNTNFAGFIKAELRGIAAGLGVSYVSLANDLEGVNYSSIRAGLLDEREEWKSIQRWFIDSFVQPIFEDWLESSLASGAIPLPLTKIEKFRAVEWKPRRWDWVDPLKDQQANVLAVEKGFKSRRSIIAEAGGDIEDTFADIAADEKLAETYGLDFLSSDEEANAQQEQPDAPDNPNPEKKKE